MPSNLSSPTSSLIDIENLKRVLRDFADERDWEQFHSPKNLAMALTGEVGELVEIFQWMTEIQSKEATQKPEVAHAISDELADVLMYLVRLSDVLEIDLDKAVQSKLALNAHKYPAEDSKGSSQKRFLTKSNKGQQ